MANVVYDQNYFVNLLFGQNYLINHKEYLSLIFQIRKNKYFYNTFIHQYCITHPPNNDEIWMLKICIKQNIIFFINKRAKVDLKH